MKSWRLFQLDIGLMLIMTVAYLIGGCRLASAQVVPFTTSPARPVLNQSILLTVSSAVECLNCTYKWDFGDGSTSSLSANNFQVSHIYANPGTYWVTLFRQSSNGQTTFGASVNVSWLIQVIPNAGGTVIGPLANATSDGIVCTAGAASSFCKEVYPATVSGLHLKVMMKPGYVFRGWKVNGKRVTEEQLHQILSGKVSAP